MKYEFTFTFKIIKMQGGRWICTDLHLMCIAQAHSISSYFNLPLAWPSNYSHCYSMAKLQMQDTLTKLEQMCNQYDPTITPRSTSK